MFFFSSPADTRAGWWGLRISDISVDVTGLTPAQKRELRLPTCCGNAFGVLGTWGLWLLITAIVPLLIVFGHQDLEVPEELQALAAPAAAILASLGVCWCCCSIRKTCCSGIFNVPEPAPMMPHFSSPTNCRHILVRRALVVYNPNAGKRRADALVRGVVVPGLEKRGVICELAKTERVGHAREIAFSRDLSGFDVIVAVGGDGTFHELVNGLFARCDGARKPVSLIPLGTGNGLFATTRQNMRRCGEEVRVWSELEPVLEFCLDRIAGGQVSKVDLLEVEALGAKLVSVMQVYLGGVLATADIDAEPFRWMGPARLELIPLWSMLKKQGCNFKCKVTLPDGTTEELEHSALAASVGLSQHWTDTKRAIPHAQLDDGQAEFLSIPSCLSIDEMLAGFVKITHGAHTQDKLFRTTQVVELVVDFGGPGVFNVDGEILKHDGSLKVRVLPRCLEVLAGEEETRIAAAPEGAEECHWRSYPKRWRMLAISCLGTMVNQAIWIGFAPIQAEVAATCDVSAEWVNALSLVFMALYVLSNFPASFTMDAYGCKRALEVGSGLNLLGAAIRCVLPVGPGARFALVFVGQVFCALAQPFFTNMPPKIAAVWFPPYQRALADTIASLAINTGAAIGFLFPTVFGLQNMLYVHLGWSLLVAALVLFCFEARPPTPASPTSEHPMGSLSKDFGHLAKNRRFWHLVVAFACAVGSFNCMASLSEALTKPYGFTADDATSFGTLTIVFGILGALIMTTIVGFTEKYRFALLTSLAISVISIGYAIWMICTFEEPSMFLMSMAWAGVGFGGTPVMPLAFEAAAHAGFPAGEGTVAGLCMSGGNILGIGFTLFLSYLVENSMAAVAWVCSVALFLLGFISVLLYSETAHRLHGEVAVDLEHAGRPLLDAGQGPA